MNSIKRFRSKNTDKNKHLQKILADRCQKRELRAHRKANLEKTIEMMLKIMVNGGISYLAIMSIKALLPYHATQQAKLVEIDAEINKIKPRVEFLEQKFSNTFDPQKAPKVMQKNSYKVDPRLTRVFFTKP